MDYPNATAGGAAQRPFGVKFYRYKNLVKKNWWVLAIMASLGLAYEGWVLYSTPVQFEASQKLTIRDSTSDPGDRLKVDQQPEQFTTTNLALMRSDDVAARVQRRLALEYPELAGQRVDLSSSVIPRSYIFTVTARSANRGIAQKFAELSTEEFIAGRVEQAMKAKYGVSGDLQEMVTKADAEVAAARAKRDKYVAENKFWKEQKDESARYLNQLTTEKQGLEMQLKRLESFSPEQSLYFSGASAGAQTPSSAAGGGDASMGQGLYDIYTQRKQDLAQLDARIRERSTVWKEKHPKMKSMLGERKQLMDAIEALMKQQAENVAQQKNSIRTAITTLDSTIAEQNKKSAEASEKDAEFQTLEAKVKEKEGVLAQAQERAQNVALMAGKNDIFVKLGRPTEEMEVPKGVAKHLLIGLIGGLVLGSAILMFRDKADDRLTSSSEMMEQFNEPILGQIPDVMAQKGNLLPLLQPEDERYSFAEAFRSLRSSLIFMPNQQALQTLLVTSAIPNEGKSTITANLGITMAAAGAKIVLVDADLRRGDLASLFDADGRTGLSNVLRGEVTWRDAVQTTKYENLTLLPRGPVTNQSSELLLLPSLEALLDQLRGEFDLVLFNTAPILATDDTPSLAPHFDGTLMVIRAQFTSARLTHNALNALYQRQVNVLGLILNCVDTEMPDYYYYQYSNYYATK